MPRESVLMASIYATHFMLFNAFEAFLFTLGVKINENESPKGCFKKGLTSNENH